MLKNKLTWILIPVLAVGVGVGVFFVSGKAKEAGVNIGGANGQNQANQNPGKPGKCKQEAVTLEGYGDKGKRLSNCFVEYPGEPTRQDKSYYVVEDICGQFTKEFVENALGQKVVKVEPPQNSSLYNCRYYLDGNEYVMINLEYLKIENQKLFYERSGDKAEKSSEIPMDNLVVFEGPKTLKGTIYLVLGPEKFISVKPGSENVEKKVNLIDVAARIAKEIKNYK